MNWSWFSFAMGACALLLLQLLTLAVLFTVVVVKAMKAKDASHPLFKQP